MGFINLEKGSSISLGKSVSLVCVEMGWTPCSNSGEDFDLDASAFMLGADGKLVSDRYFVFYNNQTSADNSVRSAGDDLTGDDGEMITADLGKVRKVVKRIVFTATIYKAKERQQDFGRVSEAYIRISEGMFNEKGGIVPDPDKQLAQYNLSEEFSCKNAVELAEFVKTRGTWHFKALGIGSTRELNGLVRKYYK